MRKSFWYQIGMLLALLLLLTVPSLYAQTGGPGLGYTVQASTIAGGGYYLTSTTWQVRGIASGGPYSLTAGADRAAGGNQCCCTYLPLILRNYP